MATLSHHHCLKNALEVEMSMPRAGRYHAFRRGVAMLISTSSAFFKQ